MLGKARTDYHHRENTNVFSFIMIHHFIDVFKKNLFLCVHTTFSNKVILMDN